LTDSGVVLIQAVLVPEPDDPTRGRIGRVPKPRTRLGSESESYVIFVKVEATVGEFVN